MDDNVISATRASRHIRIKPSSGHRSIAFSLNNVPFPLLNVVDPDVLQHLPSTSVTKRGGITLAKHSDQVRLALNFGGQQRGDAPRLRALDLIRLVLGARPHLRLEIKHVQRPSLLRLAVKPVHAIELPAGERDRRAAPSRPRRGGQLRPRPARQVERPQVG